MTLSMRNYLKTHKTLEANKLKRNREARAKRKAARVKLEKELSKFLDYKVKV